MKNDKEMKDQINASKILHSSAIYIQSMKITRSFYYTYSIIMCLFNDQSAVAYFP